MLRILYLVPCSPSGRTFGTTLRVRQIGAALQTLGAVDTVVVSGYDEEEVAPTTTRFLRVKRLIRLQPVGTRSPMERLRCGADPTFIGHHGRTTSLADRIRLLRDLPNYDLIWICHVMTADVFGQWRWPHSVMDLDDVPSEVLRSRMSDGATAAERIRAAVRLPVARGRERRLGSRFTTVCVCSDDDARLLRSHRRAHVIPNGFPAPQREPVRSSVDPPRIGFLGTCGYGPNADAIRWFVHECWPAIANAHPAVRLRVAGQGADDPALIPPHPRIETTGWVADTEAEMATWTATIVPVRVGGGTRVKIAEALSRKCPIVSTSFGAHGYDAVDGREMRLADAADGFAKACRDVISDPEEAAALATRGWQTFLEKWTWDALQPRILRAADDCLHHARQKPSTSAALELP